MYGTYESPSDRQAGVGVLERPEDRVPWVEPVARQPEPGRKAGGGQFTRFVRGRPSDPWWVRPSFLGLLAVTAVLYLWDLSASGWANSFYAAAVEAGTKSWRAFFFGSFDSSNFITVDKPPASLWVMEISARVFGLNSWSLLVPQALEGVATVGIVYATVRRWFRPAAGLIAGGIVALTPVAALMFRYDNPDSLLVLLLTGSAYCTVRAIEKSSSRWLVLAMTLVGFGFVTKMMQAFLIVPALAVAYLVCADCPLRRRIVQLVYGAAALFVSSAWWVAAVQLTPSADRPYVGGSQDNSELDLIFGYNGFGRLTGNETGSVGAGGARATTSIWGPTGITRLFTETFGGDISWLIPAALILVGSSFWLTRRAPRTDRTRVALFIFGGWMIVTGLLFSFAQGIIHPYYTVALAPAVAGAVAVGASVMWRYRHRPLSRITLAAATGVTAVWSFVLLDRSPEWLPELRYGVLVVGAAAALGIASSAFGSFRRLRAFFAAALVAAGISAAAGPLAYTLDTVATPHSGAIPTAGPTLTGSVGALGIPAGGFGANAKPGTGGVGRFPNGTRAGSLPAGGQPSTGTGAFPGANGGFRLFGGGGRGAVPGGAGAAGGLLNSSTPGSALVEVLEASSDKYEWVAATVGSNSAAGYELATDDPVMAIGGFNGTDPAPTLGEFEKYVRDREIHYFIAGGGIGSGGGGPGGTSAGSSDASEITSWVEEHYSARTVDGVTIYDLASTSK